MTPINQGCRSKVYALSRPRQSKLFAAFTKLLYIPSAMTKTFFGLALCIFFFASCNRQPETTKPQSQETPPATTVEATQNPTVRAEELSLDFKQGFSTSEQSNLKILPAGVSLEKETNTASFISEPLPVSLADPSPFLALSAKWQAEINPKAKLTISVRSSIDKQVWSEWQASSLDGDPRTKAGLFFFPVESKFIQYRVEMERDEKYSAPILKNLKFRFISPGATPSSFTSPAPDKIVNRTAWFCPDGETAPKIKAQNAPVRHLIIHHTATNNDYKDYPAMVRCIWNFHASTNGWRDLGYHYLIDPNGVIYEGKAGGDKSLGTHFSCANTGTLGIALLGNYSSTLPGKKMLDSLVILLKAKCSEFGLKPNGTSYHPSTRLNLPTISGHREANESKASSACTGTQCPGDKLFHALPNIRKTIEVKWSAPM